MNYRMSRFARARATNLFTILSLITLMSPSIGEAQTTNITSSGLGTTVRPPAVGTTSIVGGTAAGTNLFHSFGNFSIGAGEIARFETNNGIANSSTSNIISRVTGTNSSSLFGTLDTRSYFPSANFFLVNPNGIVFGPNASINVGGSANFVAGDYLRMADSAILFANPTQNSTLSVAPVTAFGFLGSNARGTITVQGGTVNNTSLLTPSTLTLVGRDVLDQGGLTATQGIVLTGGTLSNRGGTVRLVSVKTPQDAAVGGEILATDLSVSPTQGFASLGTVLMNNSHVDVSVARQFVSSSIPLGGAILIRGGQLLMSGSSISKSAFFGGVGEVTVNAQIIALTNGSTISSIASDAPPGRITLEGLTPGSQAQRISLSEQSTLSTFNEFDSEGLSAGDITLRGSNVLLDTGAQINTATWSASGRPGAVTVNANTITLINGAAIQTYNLLDGVSGAITLEGPTPNSLAQSVTLSGARLDSSTSLAGDGRGGAIAIKASQVRLDNGTTVRTTTAGENPFNNAGSVAVNANTIELLGGTSIQTNSIRFGAAAPVTLEGPTPGAFAQSIRLSGGSTINTSMQSVRAPTTTIAGNITLKANQVQLDTGAALRAQTGGTADAGNISIVAGALSLATGARISTDSTMTNPPFDGIPGDAGNISLTSSSDITVRNSSITSQATQASGGNIKLTAPNIIRIVDSTISSSVQGQAGSNGGNISIDPLFVIIQNSNLLANASAGAGGNITVFASGAVLIDPNSQLNATAGPAGVSGSVNINTPVQVLGGALVPLKIAYTQAGLSGDRCAADPKGQFSSFVQTGRDGVPQVPGALSPSPLSFLDTLTSGSLDLGTKNLAAAQLGFDSLSLDGSALVRFHTACRS